jgi:hypothetical protein
MDDELSLIEKANKAAARLEEANKVMDALVKRQEQIDARRILGGQAEAGAPKAPVLSDEEKIKIDMKNYFKGTAIEKAL